MAEDKSLEELSVEAEHLREQTRYHNYRYYVLDSHEEKDALLRAAIAESRCGRLYRAVADRGRKRF